MKVYELIKELQKLPTDAEVSIWQNGDRYAIDMIDWWDDAFVDLNAEAEGINCDEQVQFVGEQQ